MVFPPEGGELYAALVALFGLCVGHPELLQVRVFVVRQLVAGFQSDQAADSSHYAGRGAGIMIVYVFDLGQGIRGGNR